MNPFVQLRNTVTRLKEARQIASGDPYADLDEVLLEEQRRGVHFVRDGARIVGPGPMASGEVGLTPDGIGAGAE